MAAAFIRVWCVGQSYSQAESEAEIGQGRILFSKKVHCKSSASESEQVGGQTACVLGESIIEF